MLRETHWKESVLKKLCSFQYFWTCSVVRKMAHLPNCSALDRESKVFITLSGLPAKVLNIELDKNKKIELRRSTWRLHHSLKTEE